jgi:hypothetical protein
MRIRARRTGGALVLDVRGVIDHRFGPLLGEIHRRIDPIEPQTVVVNLSRARLGKDGYPTELLVKAYNLFVRGRDGRLRVVTDGGRIQHVLTVEIPPDAATTVFDYYRSEEEALVR